MKILDKIFEFLLRKSVIISIIVIILLITLSFTVMHYVNPQTVEG